MARRNIGATLSLHADNFFTNIRRANTELGGLERSTTSAVGTLKKLGGAAATVGKGFLTASAAGITAMTGLTVKALGMAGELEQNVGGSAAVFKDFAQDLQNVGKGAFETMGLSMSDFLGTANKMGALFQGSGFTIAQSAEMTTSAMQRAADVASIMGVDVSTAMEAVSGAAKGNFTMMDNLGVAINDTSIKAYAVANGIKTVGKTMTAQEKVGIAMKMFLDKTSYAAGNYAKENDTLAGSINTAKAALVTFMSGARSAEGVSNALVNVASVVSEKVGELLPTLTSGLAEVIKQLSPKIPGLLQSAMPGIITGAMSLVSGLADVFPSLIDAVVQSLPTLLPPLISGFSTVIKKLAVAITSNAPLLLSGIGEGIKSAFAGTDLSGIGDILGGALGGLGDALGGILTTAKSVCDFFVNNWGVVAPIIAGITGAVTAWKLAMAAANAVQTVAIALNQNQRNAIVAMTFSQQLQAIMTGVQTAATSAFNVVQGIMNALFVASPIGWIILAIGALIAIGVALWMNWDAVCGWISGVWQGIKQTAVVVWDAIKQFFIDWWPLIFAVFTGGLSLVVGFVVNNWDSIKNTTLAIWDGIKGFLSGAWESISSTAINVFNGVKTAILNIWDGIVSGIKGAINLILGGINGLIRGFVGGINGLINGVNNVSGAIGIPAIPTFSAPQIPMLAKGGVIRQAGRVIVGERGAEYLDLPKGAKVSPLDKGGNNEDGGAFSVLTGIKNAVTAGFGFIAGAIGGIAKNSGVVNVITEQQPAAAPVKNEVITNNFTQREPTAAEPSPVSALDLIKPVFDAFGAFSIEPAPLAELVKPVLDGIMRHIETAIMTPSLPTSEILKPVPMTIKPAPVVDIPKTAQEGIARRNYGTTDKKRPEPSPPKKEPPPTDKGKTENNFYITINADGKTSDEIVDDLMPKLKLALANL